MEAGPAGALVQARVAEAAGCTVETQRMVEAGMKAATAKGVAAAVWTGKEAMEKEKVVVVVVKAVVQAMVEESWPADAPPKPAKRSSWQEMRCQRSL